MPKSKYKRRADGRKEGTIRIDGKRIHVYGYTDEEIERQKEELIRAAHDGSLYIDKETTFEVWSKKWLELIRPNRSTNTMKMYDRSVGQLNGLIGRYPLSGLRTSDLQIALNKYAGEPRTQQILYITLSQVYDKALAEQMILKNPCVNLEKIRYKAPEKRPLSPLEKEAFESADLSDSDRLFLSLLYYCGLRRGEALALSRGQFDLKKWTVKVDAALVFETDSRSVRKPMPKTEAGFRVLPLPNAIHSLIEYYFAEHTGLYLFTMRSGDFITHNSYRAMWNRIKLALNAAAGGVNVYDKAKGKTVMQIGVISDITAHVFRHNYCTMLYYAGIPVKDAQYLMGHASPMTTLGIYTHLDNMNSSSADLLNKYLDGDDTDDRLTTTAAKFGT